MLSLSLCHTQLFTHTLLHSPHFEKDLGSLSQIFIFLLFSPCLLVSFEIPLIPNSHLP